MNQISCCCVVFESMVPYNLVEKKGEIDKLAEEYITNVRNLASEQRVEHLQKIQSAYSKCKEYSDDKVQLAMQTYEMVRECITIFPHKKTRTSKLNKCL